MTRLVLLSALVVLAMTAASCGRGTYVVTEDNDIQAVSTAAASSPLFADVTDSSGIPSLKYSEGVNMADLDGDGLPELYLPCVKGPDRLYANLGGLRFEEVTERYGITNSGGIGAAVADLDGDGIRDLFVVRGAYPYGVDVLYKGMPDGGFRDVSGPSGVAIKKNGISASVSDIDHDGDLDVFVANWGPNSMYVNEGGEFQESSVTLGLGGDERSWTGLFADFDGDGYADLFVGQGGPGSDAHNRLYENRGGEFTEATERSGLGGMDWSMGAAAADFDLDGDLDLFVTSFGGQDRLYINDGKGRFTDATAQSGIRTSKSVGVAAGCIDGDGLPDLVVAGFKGPVSVFINEGGGRFRRLDPERSGIASTYGKNEGVALGDLDEDGDLDMYVTNYDGHNRLYANNLDTGRYLKVAPSGPDAAITGAVASLYVHGKLGDPSGLVSSGVNCGVSGFCSQPPPEIILRLPDDGPYDLRVSFPGGKLVDVPSVSPGVIEFSAPQ